MRLDVTNAGDSLGDVRLMRSEFTPTPSADQLVEYELILTMKASANILFSMAVNHNTVGGATDAWAPLDSEYNVPMGTTYAEYSMTFQSPAEADQNLQFIFEMGQHDFGTPDAPNKQNPDAYTIDILYLKLVERTGSETLTSVYKSDYTAAQPAISMSNAEMGSISCADGKAVASITGYSTGGSWANKIEQDTTLTVNSGNKYRLSITMTAENAQSGEVCVEDKTLEWQARALYTGFTLEAGKEIYVGTASAGVTSNTITISNIEISQVGGDFASDTSLYRFVPYNKDTDWNYFNGKEVALDSGMGTMYEKDGTLFYRIDEISTVDYGNKLFINKIKLEKNALYRVSFTMKANKPGTVWFILNPYGEYDPRISKTFDFTTEEQTFTCETTGEFVLDMDFELVWSFGQGYNTEGDYTIEISGVTITKLT